MKYLLLALPLFLLSCSATKQLNANQASIEELKSWMIGSYDSSEQAVADTTYYNISLHMYPIWTGKEGHWLYVEQALAARQEAPYRQRVYQLEEMADGSIVSRVFKLPNEKGSIGKWKTPAYFDQYGTTDLVEREGCGVYLKRSGQGYAGATLDKNCGSTLRGASYATSSVSVFPKKIESWDQGFDANDKQVWGATLGGYVFKKLK